MTDPQSITVSLEWAKKLQKAGWKFPAYMYFQPPGHTWEEKIPAPTAEEIFRRLPQDVIFHHELGDMEKRLFIRRFGKAEWIVFYCSADNVDIDMCYLSFSDISLANACAAMYVCLSDSKLLP